MYDSINARLQEFNLKDAIEEWGLMTDDHVFSDDEDVEAERLKKKLSMVDAEFLASLPMSIGKTHNGIVCLNADCLIEHNHNEFGIFPIGANMQPDYYKILEWDKKTEGQAVEAEEEGEESED